MSITLVRDHRAPCGQRPGWHVPSWGGGGRAPGDLPSLPWVSARGRPALHSLGRGPSAPAVGTARGSREPSSQLPAFLLSRGAPPPPRVVPSATACPSEVTVFPSLCPYHRHVARRPSGPCVCRRAGQAARRPGRGRRWVAPSTRVRHHLPGSQAAAGPGSLRGAEPLS